MEIDDIRAFLLVARLGSLSQAARDHAIAKATLSLRLARLENATGSRLLERSGSGMSLTEAGARFLPHAEEVEDAHRRALDAATALAPALRGLLRVGVTEQLATNLATPLALQFIQQHRGITLDLQVMPVERLLRRELDCMICGDLPGLEEGASFVAQGFCRYRRHLYASPSYLAVRGLPVQPSDLLGHDLIGSHAMGRLTGWHLHKGDDEVVVEPAGPLTTNDEWVAKVCVLQARGISLFPDFFAREHLATGELVPVLPDWSTRAASVTVLHHSQRSQNAHIRAFISFLVAHFRGFYSYPYGPGDLMDEMRKA
jgi:DNA-binding transcriptional LysR family regulator